MARGRLHCANVCTHALTAACWVRWSWGEFWSTWGTLRLQTQTSDNLVRQIKIDSLVTAKGPCTTSLAFALLCQLLAVSIG